MRGRGWGQSKVYRYCAPKHHEAIRDTFASVTTPYANDSSYVEGEHRRGQYSDTDQDLRIEYAPFIIKPEDAALSSR